MRLHAALFLAVTAGAAAAPSPGTPSPGAPSPGAPSPAAPEAAPAAGLEDYRWKKRVVLIAAPSPTDARYLRQAEELARIADELSERNVTVVLAVPGDPRRARLPLAADDVFVLVIGLDGGIKLSRRGFLAADELRKEVDSMPLRRSELKAAERARQKGEAGAPASAAALQADLVLSEAAPGGGWSRDVHREGAVAGRCWLFDLPLRPGPLQEYPGGAALWHLRGDPVEILVLPRGGSPRCALLGAGGTETAVPFLQVQAGDRISVRLKPGAVTGWALLGETSSGTKPATDDLGRLAERFPEHATWLESLASRALPRP